MTAVCGRLAGLCLVVLALQACAGSVIRPLFGMRDTAVSREQARALTRVALVPVQLRPALVAESRGSRWEDAAYLNDDILIDALDETARWLNADGVHQAHRSDQGIVVFAEPRREPQLLVLDWLKREDASARPGPPLPDVDAVLEFAWAPFPPSIRHVVVGTRLVDARSGRVLGRALRFIIDSRFPPKPEDAGKAFRSGVDGVGLSSD